MSSMLGVRDDRRSRSKSPSGRDRDRSRSRSRETRSQDVDDRDDYSSRRSSRIYSKGESGSEDERRYKERKSSKKYYDEDDEEDTRRRKSNSRKYVDNSGEEEDRYRSYGSSKDSRTRDVPASDDDRGYGRSKKKSDSDSDRRRDTRERTSRKKYDDSEDETSDSRRRYNDRNGHSNGTYGQLPASYQEIRPAAARHSSYGSTDPRYAAPGAFPGDAGPAAQHMPSYSESGARQYAHVDQFKYADPSQISQRKTEYDRTRPSEYERTRPSEYERSRPKDSKDSDSDRRKNKYEARTPRGSQPEEDRYETREPKNKKYYDDDDDDDDKYDRRSKKDSRDKYASSTDDVSRRMAGLAVGSAALGAATLGVGRHSSNDGGKPPASPLLEPYKGTYQSISPMPSALVLANHRDDSDLSDLDLGLDGDSDDPDADLQRKIRKLEREKEKYTKGQKGGLAFTGKTEEVRPHRLPNIDTNVKMELREPGSSHRDRSPSSSILSPRGGNGKRKSVSFYDPTEDAKRIAVALSGTRSPPDPRPLVQILPRLTTDDLIALKAEYKNHAKVSGQGINMAKHIKMRIPGNLGKACYATALGRWESEAYWANSWYQGGASRRELLIESLMGRSNSDIREIKNCFKDKKYNDDLEKCIKTELRADKFRTALLLALEERRMPESSPLDIKLVKQDVVQLAEALESPGGETAMIKIIVVRSDAHLREVLRLFERTYGVNFARQMISKSRNLVGETLAHILNGALNRPMRDALLLHQAISETAPGKERTELLISRLVRMHWEPRHLEKVKAVYREKYRQSVEDAIKREVWSGMKTHEGRLAADFCLELAMSSSRY
ncbi:annexin ANXC4 [Cladophialophora carrionii]|uniref:Annexin ANXC4 n=1 Tax=Cladophialophora carrionii TaxID=86049 RepID=A0A1C1C6K0_9EURO|nr:annexin ANXC4 [Cladophialophora carrionii]